MEEIIANKFFALKSELNERQRRLWAASEAMSLGHGGVTTVAKATGMSRTTITQGVDELRNEKRLVENRVRREGAGRKNATQARPDLLPSLDALVEPTAIHGNLLVHGDGIGRNGTRPHVIRNQTTVRITFRLCSSTGTSPALFELFQQNQYNGGITMNRRIRFSRRRRSTAPRRTIPTAGAPMSYLTWSGQKAPKPGRSVRRLPRPAAYLHQQSRQGGGRPEDGPNPCPAFRSFAHDEHLHARRAGTGNQRHPLLAECSRPTAEKTFERITPTFKQENKIMNENIFQDAEVIYSYSRQNMIDDGHLIEVPKEWSEGMGFIFPLGILSEVWDECVAWRNEDSEQQVYQEEPARLNDLLYMFWKAAMKTRDSIVLFEVACIPRDGKSREPKNIKLKGLIGPGDDGRPVLTVMFPDQD